VLRDTWLVFVRDVRQSLRNPAWVMIGLTQPLLYLVLFGPLLEKVVSATPGLPPGNAWQVFVPALLIQMGLFGTAFVGFALIAEYRAGVIERMRVTPVSRTALLLGRVMGTALQLVVQAALITLCAVLFTGLRVPPLGVLLGLVLVALLGVTMASSSYALALRLKSEDALAPLLNSVLMPVLLLSGILLPMSIAPHWLYVLSRFNPFSHVVDAERAAFRGDFDTDNLLLGSLVSLGITVLAVIWGIRTFQRENA
jgi:ABC-2 type transport system permease protein